MRPSSRSFVSQEADSIRYTMTVRISVRFTADGQVLFLSELGHVLDVSSEAGRRRDQRSQSRGLEEARRNRIEQKKSLEVRAGVRPTG